MPSSCPSPLTIGPPEEPGRRGAVCSTAPATRRPRGPRNARPMPETYPTVTRSPLPAGLPIATTGEPIPSAEPSPQAIAGASPVSTPITARSPSPSAPRILPSASRPSAKKTCTSSPCRLWAFVRTLPVSTTTPDPPRHRFPIPTVEAPAVDAIEAIVLPSSSKGPIGCVLHLVACDLQCASYSLRTVCQG